MKYKDWLWIFAALLGLLVFYSTLFAIGAAYGQPPAIPVHSVVTNSAGQEVSQIQIVTNSPATNIGIIGRPPILTNAVIQWTDESLTDPSIAGYDVFCGTNPLEIPVVLTITNLAKTTNGTITVTLTNLLTSAEYYISVNAFDHQGNYSVDASDIEYIAEKYLLSSVASNSITLSYWCASTHTYTIQAATNPTGPWLAVKAAPIVNFQGVTTYAAKLGKTRQFYRLLMQ